jgi:hypothetical protein
MNLSPGLRYDVNLSMPSRRRFLTDAAILSAAAVPGLAQRHPAEIRQSTTIVNGNVNASATIVVP